MKVSFPAFKVVKAIDLEQKCTWLGMTRRGVCVAAGGIQELIVFDEDSLKSLVNVPVPSPGQFASGPGSDLIFIGSGRSELTVIDVKKKKAMQSFSTRDVKAQYGSRIKKHRNGVTLSEFKMPTMTPNGKYLFCVGFECLHRFTIGSRTLVYDQMGPRIGSNVSRIEVSPDSRYVALPSGGGNRQQDDHPKIGSYGTYIYSVTDITKAVTSITPGAYPQAVGFDSKSGLLYGQNHDTTLVTFSPRGLKQKEYKILRRGNRVRQFLVHPDGKKILILTESVLAYVVLD